MTTKSTMPLCAYCGSSIDASVCPICGGTAASPTPVISEQAANVAAALCYLALVAGGALFLAWGPYDRHPKIRFHAHQSIFLGVSWVAIWFVFSAVSLAFHLAGIFFVAHLSTAIGMTFLVFWVYMIGNTYLGREVILPVIGPAAQRQV